MRCWREMMVFPKCCLTSVYTARTGSLFLAILSSVAACRFVEDDWCFSRGCFLWKAGTPQPRQHNQCSSWLRGRGGEGEGYVAFSIWSLSALVRQSDVKEWVFFFFLTPPLFSTLPLFSLFLSLRCLWLPHPPSVTLRFLLVLFSLRSASVYTQNLLV